MPEGRRYSPDNPSPTACSLAEYIRNEGVDIEDKHVAAVWFYHPLWQPGHAEEVRQQRADKAKLDEAEKAKKQEGQAVKKWLAAEKKFNKEQDAAKRKADKKAEKAAEGADGNDATVENGEPAKTRRRLRTRDESAEPAVVGASEVSF